MAPIIEVSDNVLKGLNQLNIPYTLRNNSQKQSSDNFIYVPSINLYVAKERTHLNKNWFEAHKEIQANGERMLILPEFIEFLKYCKENHQDIYKEVTKVRNPWRAEWLDADFKVKNKKLYINSEVLDKNTLMEDKQISLEDYLNNNHTSQGLPSKKVKSGNLYYWYPRSDNNSVARFDAYSDGADLDCYGYPSYWSSNFGVRAAKQRE